MIAYLAANNFTASAAALRQELNLDEAQYDATTAKKYESLLEKKWTSVVRLQRKVSKRWEQTVFVYMSAGLCMCVGGSLCVLAGSLRVFVFVCCRGGRGEAVWLAG